MIRPAAILLIGVVVGAARSPLPPPAQPVRAPTKHASTTHASTTHASTRHGAARHSAAGHSAAVHAPIRVVVHRSRRSLPLPPLPPGHAPGAVVAGTGLRSLPMPPHPPAQALVGEPAPVPDDDLAVPVPRAQTATLHVRIFSLDEHGSGLGFIPGSAYPAPEDRKPVQTPGITVSVPVQ